MWRSTRGIAISTVSDGASQLCTRVQPTLNCPKTSLLINMLSRSVACSTASPKTISRFCSARQFQLSLMRPLVNCNIRNLQTIGCCCVEPKLYMSPESSCEVRYKSLRRTLPKCYLEGCEKEISGICVYS